MLERALDHSIGVACVWTSQSRHQLLLPFFGGGQAAGRTHFSLSPSFGRGWRECWNMGLVLLVFGLPGGDISECAPRFDDVGGGAGLDT